MTLAAEKLKLELAELPPDDRAELAMFLIESLNGDPDDVKTAWRDELDRRFSEIESGTETGEPAPNVIAALRRKYT